MIVADTILELRAHGESDPLWESVSSPILQRIAAELATWCANPNGRDRERLINSVADASYALDVLIRSAQQAAGASSVGAAPTASTVGAGPLAELRPVVHAALLRELARHETNLPLAKDTIYSAIQLGAHFQAEDQTTARLQHFFRAICVRYDRNQIQRDERSVDLQPLVLRALLTFNGPQLRDHMIAQMLDSAYDAVSQSEIQREAERNRQFEALVRKRTKITVREVVELSGGITDARVFRVNYAVNADGLSEGQDGSRTGFQTHSVVVKSGPRVDLQQSVDRYQHLRSGIQPYFAQHSRQPEVLEASPSAPAYLILEDLTDDYQTLRQIFGDIDRHRLSTEDRKAIAAVTGVVTESLFDIYRQTRRKESDLVGLQVSRLYLGRLDKALIAMCAPEKFPRLKELFRGFWLGDTRFESIERYQSLLYHHREVLRPPGLMLMHGDCHGRNLMLDECYERIKLIDLDKLDDTGDYILDIALLIEDIALFRRLFDRDYHHYLRPEQVDFPTGAAQLAYPLFVSEAAVLFQGLLLERVGAFAAELGDRHYQARLWLAIALYLLRLVEKADQIKTGAVLYAEAVKLLHALVEHLQTGKPLPSIPITRDSARTSDPARAGDPAGLRVSGPAPALPVTGDGARTGASVGAPTSPGGPAPTDNPAHVGDRSQTGDPAPVRGATPAAPVGLDGAATVLHDLLLAAAAAQGVRLRPVPRLDGRSVRYFRDGEDEPWAMLDGKRRPPGLLLRPALEDLGAAAGAYVESIRATGAFRSVLRPPEGCDPELVRAILLAALR
jgi:hypothetical protein